MPRALVDERRDARSSALTEEAERIRRLLILGGVDWTRADAVRRLIEAERWALAARVARGTRPVCGAWARSANRPCLARPIDGKRRCKFHGGLSTGPRTAEGRERNRAALARGHVTQSAVARARKAKRDLVSSD